MELTQDIKEQLESVLGNIKNNVALTVFTGEQNKEETGELLELLTAITKLIPKISLESVDVNSQHELKEFNDIKHTPAIVIHAPSKKSHYVYYGMPAQYEFSSLVEAIRTVGNGFVDLAENLIEQLNRINKPIKLDIFVTPTCGYCPGMVISAFRMSFVNPLIQVRVIDGTSFRELSREKGVRAVPKVFINDGEATIDGSVPVDQFVEKVVSLGKL